MVELAICLPLLAGLALGSAELANAYRTWQLVDTAAAEGARYAAQNPNATSDDVASYARSAVGLDGLAVTVGQSRASTSNVTLSVMGADGAWRQAPATVERSTREVTVSMEVPLLSGSVTWVASSAHAGVSSEVS